MLKYSKNIIEFEKVYFVYYAKLKRFAQEYVIREADAENIVQDVFTELWENKIFITTHTNLVAFLFTNVRNKCIDLLRHKTVVEKTIDKLKKEKELELELHINMEALEAFDVKIFETTNIEKRIREAIDALPEKCRKVFVMSKLEGKKQKLIAQELDISINTVESQMAIAYKKLKELLKDCVPLLVFLFQ